MPSTILFVDDEEEFSTLIQMEFRRQIKNGEMKFLFAFNGLEALDCLTDCPQIDMVMTDINMPEMDGLTLLSKISSQFPYVKTIVLSAYGDLKNIRTAMNCGASDFLIKPMELADLSITLERLLDEAQREKEAREEIEKSELEKTRLDLELQTAAAVQHALIPKTIPFVPNLELATYYKSASEVGGDWFGFMTKDKKYLYILIGDVTGHGTPAAIITAIASATCMIVDYIHNLSQTRGNDKRIVSPSTILHHLNSSIYQAGAPEFFMTFFAGCINLDTGTMQFSNAAHNFPILIKSNGRMRCLLNTNYRLGEKKRTTFGESSIQLEANDLLFFYTDGLTENENNTGEMWGESRMKRFLRRNHEINAQTLVDNLVQTAYDFYEGQPLKDDLTVVACKVGQDWN